MRDCLLGHFGREPKLITLVEGAIATLLDRHESSLIVLAQEDAATRIERGETNLEPLRPGVLSDSGVVLRNLTCESLAGILHLDGAHFINKVGMLTRIAEEVLPGQRDHKKENLTVTGSGGYAAIKLHDLLPDSYVIKVSAGGYLRTHPRCR